MVSIRDTQIQIIEIVMPQHINPLGVLHGGQMMEWLVNVGALAATRAAKGPIVLGAIDDVDFVNAVLVHEIVILEAQVQYVGTSSMEVGARVVAEQPETGTRKLTTSCHLTFVAVDTHGRTRPVPTSINPRGAQEKAFYEAAKTRREARQNRLAHRHLKEENAEQLRSQLRWTLQAVRPVLPEEATHSNLMFGGRLLKHMDEVGAILCTRYSKGVCVTASLDALEFYRPIRVGDILVLQAALNYIGRTSLEVSVKILVERPWKDELQHGCTAFLTYVHLGKDRRPQLVPSYYPPRCPAAEAAARGGGAAQQASGASPCP